VTAAPHLDLTRLPSYGFGPRATMYWGTLAFITLEGTGFALAIGSYLYLMAVNREWPIGARPPDLLPGSLITLVMIASAIPNYFLKRWARHEQLALIRVGLVAMSLIGVLLLAIRAYEFPLLNVSWDTNAYGSILWFLLGLHTTHLLTDVGDTAVLAVLMFTRHGATGRRCSDVEDNGVYWDFVVLSWMPMYLLIYWVPRW
jgi:cytochrome c oxidase subunit III